VEALEAKVGVDSSAVTSSLDYKVENMVETVIGTIYPIGCIYTSTVATNPATVFGFGTWAAFGAGKVLVGIDSEDEDFNEAEETGGAKTHTLTTAEMPSHTHTQNAHSHRIQAGGASGGSSRYKHATDTDVTNNEDSGANIVGTQAQTATNQNTGGDEAHNNLQPYVVVYFFKRTA
jgi:microcystin-dependent protein